MIVYDTAIYLMMAALGVIFSFLSLWLPSHGTHLAQAKAVEDTDEVEHLFRLGRYFSYLRIMTFMFLAGGCWIALGVMSEVTNNCDLAFSNTCFTSIQETVVGVAVADPFGFGLGWMFIAFGIYFVAVLPFIAVVAILRNQLDPYVINRKRIPVEQKASA